ncbi:MAG: hypothetical protein R3E55_13685 [Burkholderiaceae bacterium]
MMVDSAGFTRIVLDSLSAPHALPTRLQGAWLSLFAARTRLTEFVLREPEYRHRMMKEVDPRYWVAPRSSGNSFSSPAGWQREAARNHETLGPAALLWPGGALVPTATLFPLHSRADGRHHGIVAVAEAGDGLYRRCEGVAQPASHRP